MIKKTIIFKDDKVEASKLWVPFFISIMAWAFTTYIILKGIKHIYKVDFNTAALIGL